MKEKNGVQVIFLCCLLVSKRSFLKKMLDFKQK